MSNGGNYDPHAVESEIYKFWEQGGYFHAEPNPAKRPFVIDIPLPNVTGALHLGHAINQTLQDILTRVHRMRGYEALWMPGTDHAGIATQAVVERELKKRENITRHELGREGLVAKIWEWKEEYGGRILNQLRKMGFSCDWARTRFTLDEVCAKAVYEVFFRWFKDGLIYRGQRLVNWDAHLQTAVADDEVFHENVKGHFWHYRYPVLEGDVEAGAVAADAVKAAIARATREDAKLGVDYLSIATTRPETMLGDTALAVHPSDERYQHLIGRHVLLPLQNRAIPVIADGLLAKPELGTGCVKVTPGHDPNDYACGLRNGLPMINILTVDGKINENGRSADGAYDYSGLDRYEARKQVVAALEALAVLDKVEDYEHAVGHSDRSKTPIEPMLSEQWFLKMGELAESAMDAVRDGRVQFFPARYAKTMLDWLGEKRDWCISRQLWWGHRIPVWSFVGHMTEDESAEVARRLQGWCDEGKLAFAVDEPGSNRLGAKQVAKARFCPRPDFQVEFAAYIEQHGFEQDPDVLDTWFSSQLWPFSTLHWPDENPDLDYFYPTSVLVTARDIITLWVARMIISGLYFMKRVPFQHVCVHPNIQDAHGRRMSKSAGNGVDPLEIIELYGTDALRFTMAQMATETQDVRLPVKPSKLPDGRTVNTSEKFELGRNFCNKLWQAATGFVMANVAGHEPQPLAAEQLAVEDRWILSRLAGTIGEVDDRLSRYQINDVVSTLYTFFWSDFCDWYIELIKPRLFGRDESGEVQPRSDASADVARQVLVHVLDQVLRLFHPVVPFITEALWKQLGEVAPKRGVTELRAAEPVLIRAAWPDAGALVRDEQVEREMAALQDVIRALRDTLARINTARAATKSGAIGKLPHAVIRADRAIVEGLAAQVAVLERLGRCERVEVSADAAKPAESATQVLTGVEVYVPLGGLMDLGAERTRLQKERDALRGHIERLAGKLANEGFVSKAPAAVVAQERARLAEMRERLDNIERNLADISG